MKYIINLLFTCSLLSINIYAQVVKDGLVSYYKFNDDLLDETIYNHDLNIDFGIINYTTTSLLGHKSIYFDGNTRLQGTNIFDNSSFLETAISVWVKVPSATSSLQIIIQGSNLGFGVYIQPNTGKLLGFYGGNSANAYVSKSPITDNEWHHITTQSNGDTTYVYIDGVIDGQTSNDGFYVGNGSNDNKLFLGKSNGNTYSFIGEIYDLRIYNRVLNECEIDTLSDKNSNIGMVAYYPFNNHLQDFGTNNNPLKSSTGNSSYGSFSNGQAVYFDGSNSLVSNLVFDNSNYSQTAISMWFKAQSSSSNLQVMLQGANTGFGVYLEGNTGKLMCFFGGNSVNSYKTNYTLADNNWHHVVSQSDGVTTFVYVDGVLDGTTSSDGLYNGNGSQDNLLYLGKSNTGSYSYYGHLDDLKIYNRMLSTCEINELAKYENISSITEKIDKHTNFTVYPNPSFNKVNLDFDYEINIKSIIIYDINGKMMLSSINNGFVKTNQIDISTLEKGVYYIVLNGSSTKSIIKL